MSRNGVELRKSCFGSQEFLHSRLNVYGARPREATNILRFFWEIAMHGLDSRDEGNLADVRAFIGEVYGGGLRA